MTTTLLTLLITIILSTSSTSFHLPPPPPTPLHLHSTTPILSPLYTPPKSLLFQRIDDVIMGGVSKSHLTDVESNSDVPSSHMKFSGILRTQGGGFCGFRTAPFAEPLNCSQFSGVYMRLRFTSDDDVGKRTFKLTLRDDDTRGEYVFQQMFTIPSSSSSSSSWFDVKVPFEELLPVRGPVINKEGRNFNESNVMQIGVVVSKFVISETMQSISDFRPGYFSMDFNEIGFYTTSPTLNSPLQPPQLQPPKVQNPLPLSLFVPIFKLFFNEQSRRRRAAYIALRERTGKGWFHVASMGFKGRKKNYGLINAIITFAGRVGMDGLKGVLGWSFKVAVFYPVRTAFRIKKKIMGGRKKDEIA